MPSTEQREVHIQLFTTRANLPQPMSHPDDWMAGVWTEWTNPIGSRAPSTRRSIFGLTSMGGPTHYAYELGEGPGQLDPIDLIRHLAAQERGRFYFDAGNTRAPIWATRDELARVFVDLDLIPSDWDQAVVGEATGTNTTPQTKEPEHE